ncbi:DUF438 domain-containing protein [Leptolyngbya sp. AN03gr2]|uniref:DUF438 domain-containing protein n=1 Tax=unclassified Leptolyngbya TaxID=2650499 RepID=UPI003D31ED55
MKTTVKGLPELLERLHTTEATTIKQEVQAFLRTLNPQDLVIAEQAFVDAGLNPGDIHHLCSAHLELFGDAATQLKQHLPDDHVIRIMLEEHDVLLAILNELEALNESIQHQEYLSSIDIQHLRGIAQQLLDAEPHHQREEQVLFVEVEKRGLFGPPQVMTLEHEELRTRKRALLNLITVATQIDTQEFKHALNTIASILVLTLRDHILKENNILYPAALQTIPDAAVWQDMKEKCDRIGYCRFMR